MLFYKLNQVKGKSCKAVLPAYGFIGRFLQTETALWALPSRSCPNHPTNPQGNQFGVVEACFLGIKVAESAVADNP